jgi:hypothetical protein
MNVSRQHAFFLLCLSLPLASCAHREARPIADRVPFDQRLSNFQSLHNRVQTEELRAYFAKDASIQSPITPRPGSVEKYLSALKAEPYQLEFGRTEVIYSLPRRAATRSEVTARAPGRFELKERVTVDWRVDNGYWRISRIVFSDWSPMVGTWRRSGPGREGLIELRVLPDGNYLVFAAGDFAVPAFRGRYRLERNNIAFADSSANDPQQLQTSEGSYRFARTPTGIDLSKIQDENPWRAERFAGLWVAGH